MTLVRSSYGDVLTPTIRCINLLTCKNVFGRMYVLCPMLCDWFSIDIKLNLMMCIIIYLYFWCFIVIQFKFDCILCSTTNVHCWHYFSFSFFFFSVTKLEINDISQKYLISYVSYLLLCSLFWTPGTNMDMK
jgi:hypothetical protein